MISYIALGGIVMIPIGIVSVIAFAIVLEKMAALVKFRKPSSAFLAQIFESVRKREWEFAQSQCQKSRHPLAQILNSGLSEITKESTDLRAVEEVMKLTGDEIIQELESSLKFLGTLIHVLPLLGFLGTIIGLIFAFQKWEALGTGVTISELSGGIYQAMITTAAGLILVIPYLFAYGFFTSRVEAIELQLSKYATEFLSRLRASTSTIEADSASSRTSEKFLIKQPLDRTRI